MKNQEMALFQLCPLFIQLRVSMHVASFTIWDQPGSQSGRIVKLARQTFGFHREGGGGVGKPCKMKSLSEPSLGLMESGKHLGSVL